MAGGEYRSLNRTVAIKLESPSGTDATPTVGSNAVRMEKPIPRLQPNQVSTNEVTGSLDGQVQEAAGGYGQMPGRVYLKGSGAPETPPEWGVIMKVAGFAETVLDTAETGTAQAGDTDSITLAASGPSATDDAYLGMPIQITGGTGSGQKGIITAYDGTTKVATVHPPWLTTTPDATSTYAIPKCVRYQKTSTSLPTATVYNWAHRSDGGNSRLDKLLGAVATLAFNFATRQIPYMDVTLQGGLAVPTDVSAPGAPTYSTALPPPWIDSQTCLDALQEKIRTLSYDVGNQLQSVDDPNAAYGYDVAAIAQRNSTGSVSVPMALLSVRNFLSMWLAGSTATLSSLWGSTAGNRFAMLIPQIRYSGQNIEDVQGLTYETLPFGTPGSNVGLILTQW